MTDFHIYRTPLGASIQFRRLGINLAYPRYWGLVKPVRVYRLGPKLGTLKVDAQRIESSLVT